MQKRIWIILPLYAATGFWSPSAQAIRHCDTCDPDAGTGTPAPSSAGLTIGSQCSLPGPHADDRCTVLYHVRDNAPNNIVCLWNDNALVACEGRTVWGGGFDYIPAVGASLEFRKHAAWPTQHPLWPDAAAVRATGTLLKQQSVVARHRASPAAPCDTIVPVGANIQSAMSTGASTICLGPGVHASASTLLPLAGQTLRSADPAGMATLLVGHAATGIDVRASGVTLKQLVITSTTGGLAQSAIVASGAANLLVDDVSIHRVYVPLAIQQSSSVELRGVRITAPGDGVACAGCAQPSIWINQSADVRVVRSVLEGNGTGPEGDGELACYDSADLLVQNSTIAKSGASGMYLVNCDRAVVIGNLVSSAREWGLDITQADRASGSDFGLFEWNRVEYSRNGGAVLHNSTFATFTHNQYVHNRSGPNASGECNGVNRRGNTHGFWSLNDTGTPWPVYCND